MILIKKKIYILYSFLLYTRSIRLYAHSFVCLNKKYSNRMHPPLLNYLSFPPLYINHQIPLDAHILQGNAQLQYHHLASLEWMV